MSAHPYQYADGRIRDVTHAMAKKLVRLARRVARGPVDQLVVEEARRLVSDLEAARNQRAFGAPPPAPRRATG